MVDAAQLQGLQSDSGELCRGCSGLSIFLVSSGPAASQISMASPRVSVRTVLPGQPCPSRHWPQLTRPTRETPHCSWVLLTRSLAVPCLCCQAARPCQRVWACVYVSDTMPGRADGTRAFWTHPNSATSHIGLRICCRVRHLTRVAPAAAGRSVGDSEILLPCISGALSISSLLLQ